MTHRDVLDWILNICAILICMVSVFEAGKNVGRSDKEQILKDLCYETNGRYDFCIENKQWDVK